MLPFNVAVTDSRKGRVSRAVSGIDRRSFIQLLAANSAFLAAAKASSRPPYYVGAGYSSDPYTAASVALSACGQFPTNLAGQTVVIKPNLVIGKPSTSGARKTFEFRPVWLYGGLSELSASATGRFADGDLRSTPRARRRLRLSSDVGPVARAATEYFLYQRGQTEDPPKRGSHAVHEKPGRPGFRDSLRPTGRHRLSAP